MMRHPRIGDALSRPRPRSGLMRSGICFSFSFSSSSCLASWNVDSGARGELSGGGLPIPPPLHPPLSRPRRKKKAFPLSEDAGGRLGENHGLRMRGAEGGTDSGIVDGDAIPRLLSCDVVGAASAFPRSLRGASIGSRSFLDSLLLLL